MISAILAVMTDTIIIHRRHERTDDLEPVYSVLQNVKCLIAASNDNRTNLDGIMNMGMMTRVYFLNDYGIKKGDIAEFDGGIKREIDSVNEVNKFGVVFSYFDVSL